MWLTEYKPNVCSSPLWCTSFLPSLDTFVDHNQLGFALHTARFLPRHQIVYNFVIWFAITFFLSRQLIHCRLLYSINTLGRWGVVCTLSLCPPNQYCTCLKLASFPGKCFQSKNTVETQEYIYIIFFFIGGRCFTCWHSYLTLSLKWRWSFDTGYFFH